MKKDTRIRLEVGFIFVAFVMLPGILGGLALDHALQWAASMLGHAKASPL